VKRQPGQMRILIVESGGLLPGTHAAVGLADGLLSGVCKTLNFLFCSFLVVSLSRQLVVTLVFTKSSIVVTLMTTHDDESSHRSSPCRQESSYRSSPYRQESSSGRHRVVTSRHHASAWSSSVFTLVVTGLHQKKAT
jgi:hypothetical protein